jgi:hypothetical protein
VTFADTVHRVGKHRVLVPVERTSTPAGDIAYPHRQAAALGDLDGDARGELRVWDGGSGTSTWLGGASLGGAPDPSVAFLVLTGGDNDDGVVVADLDGSGAADILAVLSQVVYGDGFVWFSSTMFYYLDPPMPR